MNKPPSSPSTPPIQETNGANTPARLQGHTPAIIALAVLILLYLGPVLPPFSIGARLGSDIINQYFPSLHLQQSILRQGHLPLWNPYSFSGAPLMANMQRSALFYPVTLLYAVAPIATAIPWVEAIHLFIAAVGMYLLLFEYTRNRWSGLFAAVAWVFGGFFANRLLMGHLPQLEVCAYLPLLMLLLERMLAARRFSAYSIGLGLTFALTVFAGYPESLFMSALVPTLRFLVELVYRLLAGKSETNIGIPPMLLNAAAVVAIALGVSAVQLLPTFELIGYSARVHTDWAVIHSRSMPPMNLATLALPDFLGGIALRNAVQGSPIGEMSAYAGVTTLLLAFAAPLLRPLRTCRTTPFYLALLLLSLMLSLGGITPVYRIVFALPGFHQIAAPMRWVFFTAFAMPVLAGLSLHALLDLRMVQRPRLQRTILFVGMAAVVGLLAALGYGLLKGHIIGYFSHLITARYPNDSPRRLAKLPEFYRLQLIQLWLFAGLAALATVLLRWRSQTLTTRQGTGFAFLMLALLVVDLAYVNVKNVLAIPTLTPAMAAGGDYAYAALSEEMARENPGSDKGNSNEASVDSGDAPYRVLPLPDADAYPDQNLPIGIASAVGYDPIELSSYRQILAAWEGVSDGDLDSRAPLITNGKSPLADRWNVRYLVTRTQLSDPELQVAAKHDDVWVYRTKHPDPRAYIVHRVESHGNEAKVIAAMQKGAGGFPAGSALIVGGRIALQGTGPAEVADKFRQPDPNHLVIDVTSHGSGLLVIADTYYSGWKAIVDGVESSVVPVNGAMRGVYLNDGKHHVELRYDCAPFRIGAIISGIVLLVALAGWGLLLARQGKTQRPEEKTE